MEFSSLFLFLLFTFLLIPLIPMPVAICSLNIHKSMSNAIESRKSSYNFISFHVFIFVSRNSFTPFGLHTFAEDSMLLALISTLEFLLMKWIVNNLEELNYNSNIYHNHTLDFIFIDFFSLSLNNKKKAFLIVSHSLLLYFMSIK